MRLWCNFSPWTSIYFLLTSLRPALNHVACCAKPGFIHVLSCFFSTFGFVANLPAWCAKKDITGVIANRPDLAISLKATSTSTNSTKLNHAGFAIREKINFWRNFSDSLSQLHLRMLMSSSSSKARARKKRERELWVPQTHLNLSQCQLFLSIWIIFVFSPRLVESNESFNLKLSSRIA